MLKKTLLFTLSLIAWVSLLQAQTNLEISVSSSTDDAEELSASEQNSTGLEVGDLDLESSDLELVDDASWNGVGQTVGIRFTNLNIPQGALILNAHIEFTIDDANSDPTTVYFKVQDASNAATFANSPYNISSRTTFEDSVSWDIPEWTSEQVGETRETPALSSLVQRLISSDNWSAGNAIAFIITGSGEREVTTFDKDPDAAPKLVVTYLPINMAASRVASSTDDAEELSASEQNSTGLDEGDLDLASSDLELVDDASWNGVGQTVGIRFANLDVPQGAVIQEAYIEFAVDDDNSGETTVEFAVEDTDNATTFANSPFNISSRSTLGSAVSWSIPEWTTSEIGQIRNSPDVSALVQEIVNKSGWSAGNALAFIITGSGEREVTTFDANPDLAPRLVVKFIPSGTLMSQVSSSTDDAEELSESEQNSTGLEYGDLDLESSDLELVDDASWNGVGQTVGIRFSNINLPQYAVITNAYIEFTVDDDNSGETTVYFKAEDTDNPSTFANTPFNISSRPTLGDSVQWTIPEWTSADIGQPRQSPSLTNLVSQVVSRDGWSAGNSIAFIITGTGEREVTTFDADPDLAPKLVVEYLEGEITYVPEVIKEIPDQELVAGWDIGLELNQFFRDQDSEITYSASVTGTDTLPTGLSVDGNKLVGTHNLTGAYNITVTASSDGDEASDEFTLTYLAPSGEFTLAIFHNNDGESDLLPDSITVFGEETVGGSISQFKATLDSLRAQAITRGYETMMLSSGDNFLAGLEYNASQANGVYYDAVALDSLDYDAIDLGNHDFDFGTEVLAEFINAFSTNPAPYLSSNLSFENVPALQALVDDGRIKSSTIITKGGEQIGVIGLTTPLLPIISSPGNTTVSEAIVDSVQKEINLLTDAGVNKIILISHLQNYNEDIDLASQVSGVDIIIAGGGDELLTNDSNLGDPYNIPVTDIYPVIATDSEGNPVYIVTTPGGYRYLGNLIVDFNAAGEVTKVYESSDPVLVKGPSDPDLVTVIEDPIRTYIGDLTTNVIAVAEDTLDYLREHLRMEETNGGNLFADALLWQAKKNAASFGVKEPQVALQNSGGLRIESLIMPGDFTEDLTYEIAAFTNIVSVVEDISPEKFLELIEHGVERAPVLDGRFPQIAGFDVVYYQGEPADMPGVKSIMLDNGTMIVEDGEVVPGAPSITLATIDFTAGGGDGYPFAPLTYTTLGTTYQQAFRNYLAEPDGLNGTISETQYPFNAPKSRIIPEVYESPAIQSIVLHEDFNDCPDFPPAGWTAYSVASNNDWSCTDDTRGASGEAGDYGADVASEDWLITPKVTLDDKAYVLNFNSMLRYGGPALEVLYSTDYSGSGDPNTATWTVHPEATAAVDDMDSWDYVHSGDISLDGLTGDVYFAFKYVSSGTSGGQAAIYRVDDVTIKTETLLYENFNSICDNGNYAPEGWTVAELGAPGIVSCSSEGFENDPSDYSLQCNGYSVGAGEVWVITPLLGLGDTDYALTFASKVQYSGPMPVVLYSTDYSGVGDPNMATWSEITEASDAITTTFGKSPEIDLSFIESDAYVAFKYVSEGSSGGQSRIFLLDEVEISEPAEITNAGDVLISEIQGTVDESPLINNIVTTTGIVTGYFNGVEPYTGAGYNGNIEGFYMQDPIGDGDDNTSEGIFVYSEEAVSVGDSIVVTGLVTEFFGLTEITEVTDLQIVSSGNMVPSPVAVMLPLESQDAFERYESMMVEFPEELTVTENRNLENFGELRLSADGVLYQPTQVVDPNDVDPEGVTASGNSNVPAVNEFLETVQSKNFILDDARTNSYPTPIPYTDENNTVRVGTKVNGLQGILSYGFSNYRIQPTVAPKFTYADREELPAMEDASLKVVAFNVLNYFNGDGQGGGFPTSRGASTYDEFMKQTEKIVSALVKIDGDVVGLMEIENDEDNGYSAIKDLVDALNTELGADVYDFVSTGIIAPATAPADEIKVGFIYKSTTVGLDGDYAVLTNAYDAAYYDDYNRPALAQTFVELANNEKFTVVVNHFKSKGSGCDELGDPNDSDGQGNCNVTRTKAAGTLASWLETDPTNSGDEDFLIIGDLNAYGQEDPIDTLRSRGYTNLLGTDEFSYIFDGQVGTLDYGMANSTMLEQVTDATVWHINSVEPDMLSYDGETDLYEPTPYRASDHDPVIIGLDMTNIPPLRVSSFTLVDAWTDEDVMTIEANDTIDYADLDSYSLNIRANVDSVAKKVVLILSGRSWAYTVDRNEPYSLFFDWGDNYFGRYLRPGRYSIAAYPVRKSWLWWAEYGEGLNVNFTVVDSDRGPWFKSGTIESDQETEVKSFEGTETTIYPVPFSSQLNIAVETDSESMVTVEIMNSIGVKVYSKKHHVMQGRNIITENLSELAKGVYIVKIPEIQVNKVIMKE